jgi:hypothetical protein
VGSNHIWRSQRLKRNVVLGGLRVRSETQRYSVPANTPGSRVWKGKTESDFIWRGRGCDQFSLIRQPAVDSRIQSHEISELAQQKQGSIQIKIPMLSTRTLTSHGEKIVKDVADRHGVSADAVRTLLFALEQGGGKIAQFSHPELGGNGQWTRGGMTMVGDMFNDRLKATVNALCSELSSILSNQELFVPFAVDDHTGGSAAKNAWWPAELGIPSSTGSQNDVRYAYFPLLNRIAILQGARVQIYDTEGHNIQGVHQQQQQQSGISGGLQFTSQNGTFGISTLPILSPERKVGETSALPNPPPSPAAAIPTAGKSSPAPVEETLKTLERIAELHQKGILSDEEFRSKKAELLSRL